MLSLGEKGEKKEKGRKERKRGRKKKEKEKKKPPRAHTHTDTTSESDSRRHSLPSLCRFFFFLLNNQSPVLSGIGSNLQFSITTKKRCKSRCLGRLVVGRQRHGPPGSCQFPTTVSMGKISPPDSSPSLGCELQALKGGGVEVCIEKTGFP